MKLTVSNTLAALLLLATATPVLSHPEPATSDVQLSSREPEPYGEYHSGIDARSPIEGFFADIKELWKRKGGGSSGGKGGTGSSSSSSSSSNTKGSSSSTGSTGSSSSPSNRGSSSSNVGGQTKTGSGVQPNYGGGRFYGGGASTPYTSGIRSPLGITPLLIGVAAVAALSYPWHYPYGFYSYPYFHPYTFHNHTAPSNATITSSASSTSATPSTTLAVLPRSQLARKDVVDIVQTKPVTCLCAQYAVCGCDDSGNSTFLDSLIGDGDYTKLNQSLVTVADINGTSTIILNGTLPNGTTAPGGTDSVSSATRSIGDLFGYWVMVALVGCTVFFA